VPTPNFPFDIMRYLQSVGGGMGGSRPPADPFGGYGGVPNNGTYGPGSPYTTGPGARPGAPGTGTTTPPANLPNYGVGGVSGGNIAPLNPFESEAAAQHGVMRALKARGRDPSYDFSPVTQALYERASELLYSHLARGGALGDAATNPQSAQGLVNQLVDAALTAGSKMFGGATRESLSDLAMRASPANAESNAESLLLARLLGNPKTSLGIASAGLYGGLSDTMSGLLTKRLVSAAGDYQQEHESGALNEIPGINLLARLLGVTPTPGSLSAPDWQRQIYPNQYLPGQAGMRYQSR
jgi:hypothetical protein